MIDDHCTNEWAGKIGAAWGDDEDSGREKMIKLGGHTMVPVSATQLQAWQKSTEPVYTQWAADVNKSGVDAKKALDELRKELATRKGGH